jgi:hypothetical protein
MNSQGATASLIVYHAGPQEQGQWPPAVAEIRRRDPNAVIWNLATVELRFANGVRLADGTRSVRDGAGAGAVVPEGIALSVLPGMIAL